MVILINEGPFEAPMAARATVAAEVSKFDLHCHSLFSGDGRVDIMTLARLAREKGMTGLCITDHNDQKSRHAIAGMRGHESLQGFLLFSGLECSTTVGHMLGIGCRSEVKTRLPPDEQADAIRAAGGVPVVSHPFRRINGLGWQRVEELVARKKLNAIEVFNARDPPGRHNRRSQELATKHDLGGTGGSDAHWGVEVANAYTVVPGRIERVDELLDAIEKRATWGEGVRTSPSVLLRQGAKNVWLWAKRGFRPI